MLYAALLGYRLDMAVLAACGQALPEAVLAALEQARGLDLTVVDARTPAVYRFRHALTREAIREALEPDARRSLHALIAARLETLPDAALRSEQLAHHWLAAGDAAKASRYWERAAECARRLGAHVDAAIFADRARAIAP